MPRAAPPRDHARVPPSSDVKCDDGCVACGTGACVVPRRGTSPQIVPPAFWCVRGRGVCTPRVPPVSPVLFVLQGELKVGWLYKRGKVVKSWRKRWFVLSRDTLTYFVDSDRVSARAL